MREALVRHAAPQKIWPTVEMIRIVFVQPPEPSADSKTAIELPPASVMPAASDAANVKASSSNQPMRAVEKIERHTPLAAASAAPWVSSEMCAQESKPVIVYCVSRKPSGST